MKKIFTTLVILFCVSISAQTQDLYSLAKGDFLGMNALFNQKDNLYGYIALYGYGKSSEKTKKFEYVILDKNLNPVANKEFEGDITAGNYFGYIDFKNQIILQPTAIDYSLVKSKDLFSPASMAIDPTKNTVTRKIYYDYDNGAFKEITQPKNWRENRKENKEEKKAKGYNYVSAVFEIKEGGYLALEFNDYGPYVSNNSLIKFDDAKKEIWRYKYNTGGNKKTNEDFTILEKDEKYIYALLQKTAGQAKTFDFLALDMKTGKEVVKQPITGLPQQTLEVITSYISNYRRLDNDKTFDDKIINVGKMVSGAFSQGFARLLVDKTNLTASTKELPYTDFAPYIKEINQFGDIEKGYTLQTKDFYFLKDGSVGILMEKYKPQGNYSAPKTTDLVYAYTDKDFKLKGVKIFQKEKTKWADSDYLFSQYINDGKDVVFFYRDLVKDEATKEKKWNLYINTLINGEFKQEVVPISEKDKFSVTPYVGKEGYILLQEFSKEEKYNKVRLERLNF